MLNDQLAPGGDTVAPALLIVREHRSYPNRSSAGAFETLARRDRGASLKLTSLPSLTGAAMNIAMKCTLGTLLVFGILCCGSSGAQTAPAGQANNEVANAVPAAQSDAALKSTRPDDTFIIGNDDLLAISVWKEADLTKLIPVRSDGMISLPLIGEVQAAGRTPPQLEQDITAKLRSYITDPQVSVIVQEIRSLKFNILGQVNKPGAYSLTAGTTIVDAIATAGGFRDFAKKKGIYILRQDSTGNSARYAFNYQEFIKGKSTQQNIVLKPRDTVVVP